METPLVVRPGCSAQWSWACCAHELVHSTCWHADRRSLSLKNKLLCVAPLSYILPSSSSKVCSSLHNMFHIIRPNDIAISFRKAWFFSPVMFSFMPHSLSRCCVCVCHEQCRHCTCYIYLSVSDCMSLCVRYFIRVSFFALQDLPYPASL